MVYTLAVFNTLTRVFIRIISHNTVGELPASVISCYVGTARFICQSKHIRRREATLSRVIEPRRAPVGIPASDSGRDPSPSTLGQSQSGQRCFDGPTRQTIQMPRRGGEGWSPSPIIEPQPFATSLPERHSITKRDEGEIY